MMKANSKFIQLLLFFFFLSLSFSSSYAQVDDNVNVTESGDTIKKKPRDDIYDRHITENKKILTYEYLHEKDMFWEKRIWRIIDIREKRNHHFAYEIKPFINVLLDAADKGDLQLYNVIADENNCQDCFSYPLSKDEMQSLLKTENIIKIFDPETFEEKDTVVVNILNPKDVKQYRLKEVYFFDEERSDLGVRILGIAPIVDRYDDNGNFLNSGPMFWCYYPEAREVLGKEKYFNENNDVDNFSWEEVFEARLFSSYIIKESNVYDRRIQDYKSGQDLLFESHSIKDGIFHFEHDLWDY